MNACCGNLNVKRFGIASAAVFIAYYAMNFVVHGVLLHPIHSTQAFLRPEEQMWEPRYAGSLILFHVIFSVMFVWIFLHGRGGKKWEGLRYGFYVWLFVSVTNTLLWYALMPTGESAPWEIALALPQMLILGLIAAALYKPKESAA